jgi:hypothetical protein
MFKKVNLLAATMTLASLNVAAASLAWNPTPYIGLSGQVDSMKFEERYGAPLFNRKLLSGGVFAGVMFNDYIGLELGYNVSERKQKIKRLCPGQYMPGSSFPVERRRSILFKTEMFLDAFNFGLVTFYPLNIFNGKKTSLFCGAGGSIVRLRASQISLDDTGITPRYEHQRMRILAMGSSVFKNRDKKVIPYFRLGMQQEITERISLRISANWKMTSLLSKIKSKTAPTAIPKLKLKNTLGLGMSLIYTLN